eukprot:CAMPEP_0201573068 /NCGR_PEP_ID=MMETSP0190_2-20130828/16707_1 /ASSEMBLY_ACC=CAM_ASM_000263 /TAXON_ID=37353 /ORGANISM="Rosalina sp." /LENGTH=181 /DNA_ID=CAMNT_0047999591 /DNA_START=93 /DNA_END=638 /DNA_ORIENTATION=-
MSASRIPLTLKSFTSRFGNRMALYSSTAVLLGGAGLYTYHSTQPTSTVIASQNNPNNEVISYSKKQLYHDHASSSNTNKKFQRITIPSGKATVINYGEIQNENNLRHVLITVQGEGEIHYQPAHEKILFGTENQIIHKKLKLGNSVGVPATNWHQIVNKHDSKDLVLVVTSLPSNQQKKEN